MDGWSLGGVIFSAPYGADNQSINHLFFTDTTPTHPPTHTNLNIRRRKIWPPPFFLSLVLMILCYPSLKHKVLDFFLVKAVPF